MLIGRLLFEVVIIFIGVTAAFALEAARQERADAAYRNGMIAALIPTINDFERHSDQFQKEAGAKIAAFDAALARGEQPKLPIYRERGGERPPSRAWDGIVATGVSKALPPDLYYELSRFYTRQESFGERYVRYAQMTEQQNSATRSRPAGYLRPKERQAEAGIRRLCRPVARPDRVG